MRSLRILILNVPKWGLPFVLQDCLEGFTALGHSVRISDLVWPAKLRIERLRNEIDDFSPDFVFTLDHIGLMPTGFVPQLLTILKIPYISWFINDPSVYVVEDALIQSISPYCGIFVCDQTYIEGLKRIGFENVFYLPMASNSRIFKEIILTEEEKRRYGCNISFAGSSNYDQWYRYYEQIKDEKVRSLIDEIIRRQINEPFRYIADIIEEVERSHNLELTLRNEAQPKKIGAWLERVAVTRYRLELIEGVCDFGLCLYGDDGWRDLIDERIDFRGWVDNRTELPLIYNGTEINLNITQFQLKTALPMRIFDIAACGSFLVTDYREDLEKLFELDREVIVYRDKDDLIEKVRYFLDHPECRKEIANRAKLRVLREHTYRVRMNQLVDIVRQTFNL